jgi:hypothetical protein
MVEIRHEYSVLDGKSEEPRTFGTPRSSGNIILE